MKNFFKLLLSELSARILSFKTTITGVLIAGLTFVFTKSGVIPAEYANTLALQGAEFFFYVLSAVLVGLKDKQV